MTSSTPSPDFELDALFARLRTQRVDLTRTEYAFETRLLARLRAERQPASSWAHLSWRMIPFFALFVVGLGFWQVDVAAKAQEAAQMAYLESPDLGDLGNN